MIFSENRFPFFGIMLNARHQERVSSSPGLSFGVAGGNAPGQHHWSGRRRARETRPFGQLEPKPQMGLLAQGTGRTPRMRAPPALKSARHPRPATGGERSQFPAPANAGSPLVVSSFISCSGKRLLRCIANLNQNSNPGGCRGLPTVSPPRIRVYLPTIFNFNQPILETVEGCK